MPDDENAEQERAEEILHTAKREPATASRDEIYELLESTSNSVRWKAFGALGYVSERRSGLTPQMKTAAEQIQPLLSDDSQVLERLINTKEDNTAIQTGIARAFAELNKYFLALNRDSLYLGWASVKPLLELLDTDNIETKRYVTDALAQVASNSPKAIEPAAAALESELHSEDRMVRFRAAQALAHPLSERSADIVLNKSLDNLLTTEDDALVAGAARAVRERPDSVDLVCVLWALVRPAMEESDNDNLDEIEAEISQSTVRYGSGHELSEITRREAIKEIARIAHDNPEAIDTCASQVEEGTSINLIEYIFGALLSDDDSMVSAHTLRLNKRLHESLGYSIPGDDAGYLTNYVTTADLKSMLSDDYADVRADATATVYERIAFSHGKYGPHNYEEVVSMLPQLQACLVDADEQVRINAAQALEAAVRLVFEPAEKPGAALTTHPDLDDEFYNLDTELLVSALRDETPAVNAATAQILTQLLSPPELQKLGVTAETARTFLDADSEDVREQGARILERLILVNPETARPLVDQLNATLEHNQACEPAASALTALSATYPEAIDLNTVYESISDNDAFHIGRHIADAGFTDDSIQTLMTQLRPLLVSQDETVRLRVLKTIREIVKVRPEAGRPVVDDIEAYLSDDEKVPHTAAEILVHCGVVMQDDILLDELLTASDDSTQRDAVQALNRAAQRRPAKTADVIEVVEPVLISTETDDDTRIRRTAIRAVRAVATDWPRAARPLIQPLNQIQDSDTQLQSEAAAALEEIEHGNRKLSEFTE